MRSWWIAFDDPEAPSALHWGIGYCRSILGIVRRYDDERKWLDAVADMLGRSTLQVSACLRQPPHIRDAVIRLVAGDTGTPHADAAESFINSMWR